MFILDDQDPTPVNRLKRREGRRPAIRLGLRDNENDSGVIKVWSRKLQVSPSSLTIPVSGSITAEQVCYQSRNISYFRKPTEERAS